MMNEIRWQIFVVNCKTVGAASEWKAWLVKQQRAKGVHDVIQCRVIQKWNTVIMLIYFYVILAVFDMSEPNDCTSQAPELTAGLSLPRDEPGFSPPLPLIWL